MRNITVAIAAALLASLTAPMTAHANEEEAASVMVVGDSVTHGQHGDHTWRYFASKRLGNRVDFVGPHRGTIDGENTFGGSYADPNFDQDHASRWGLSMWETLYWNSETAPSVASLMVSDPEVVVVTLGFNDLIGMNQSPEQTVGHMGEFVSRVRAINPDVDFVLGSLPQEWYEKIAAYNDLLPAAASALSTPGSEVVVTPTAVLELGVDTYDAAHPTTSGDRLIADAVLSGLSELGIEGPEPQPEPIAPEPEPAPVVPQPVTPAVVEAIAPPANVTPPPVVELSRPRGVKVVKAGRKVRVTWRAVDGAETYRVDCGPAKTTTRTTVKVRATSRKCTVRAINDTDRSPATVARLS
jgi:hypothetical protein